VSGAALEQRESSASTASEQRRSRLLALGGGFSPPSRQRSSPDTTSRKTSHIASVFVPLLLRRLERVKKQKGAAIKMQHRDKKSRKSKMRANARVDDPSNWRTMM